MDKLDEERCRRAEVGMILAAVPVVVEDVYGYVSVVEEKKWSEVEEVVEATEAV